jgi:hypothetical protein
VSVVVAVSLALALAVLAAPAAAANSGHADQADPADQKSLLIWAYFDGDTPVSGGRVRVYVGRRELRPNRSVETLPGGEAVLRFDSLPSALRIVVIGGRAGGEQVQGSLKTKVRGVTDGELVHVNPVTTVSDLLAHAEDGFGLRHARDLTERTLGIRPFLDNHDLYVTDRWFEGDRFERWALEQGSVEAGARALVRHIERPGFDRRRFRPWDGGGPKTRAAASGGASAGNVLNGLLATPSGADAADVINGLLDGIAGAAALTGPEGFAVSAAAVFFKKLISLGLEDKGDKGGGEDPVSAQLRGLSAQVTDLKKFVGERLLRLEIAPTKVYVRDIAATQDKFLFMLDCAQDAHNQELPERVRNEALTALPNATKTFLRGAEDLVDHNVEVHLNAALIDKQIGPDPTDPNKTLTGDALIPAVRDQIGKERFFTNESSQQIRSFFRYYEWAQTQLATTLTEFYVLGGPCAKSWADLHPGKLLTSNDCKPDRRSAGAVVKDIKDNIAKQRSTLPPKVLDDRVFIDRNTHLMWRLEPTRRMNPEILDGGLHCVTRQGADCIAVLDKTATVFDGFDYPSAWNIPSAPDYRALFDGPGGPDEPLARLNSLGVRYQGEPLKAPAYFWLVGDFYLRKHQGDRHLGFDKVDRIDALVFRLAPGAKGPTTENFRLGFSCDLTLYTKPTCQDWNRVVGAYILWKRGPMSDGEGGDYWCEPTKQRSWDPAKC